MAEIFGTKNCQQCNIPIECQTKRDVHRRKFCSRSCRSKHTVKQMPGGNTFGKVNQDFGYTICIQCHQPTKCRTKRDIKRKKFCSRTCCAIHSNQNRCETKKIKNFSHLGVLHRESLKGEDHPQYKRDRSQLKSKRPPHENLTWSHQVLKRDKYKCQQCGRGRSKKVRLHCDHIKSYVLYPELRWDINNGRTLCIDCHKKTDSWGRSAAVQKRRVNE